MRHDVTLVRPIVAEHGNEGTKETPYLQHCLQAL